MPVAHRISGSSRTPPRMRITRRQLWIAGVLVALLILVLLPPYINVNRFQRRIASNISASLGRPVHFNNVSLSMLPLPGLSLEDFVVDEDPAFGSEPILRAPSVRVRLRISSLWHSRVEFSKITFTDPSVNLVHTADGRWNLQSVLMHASRIDAAPTAQTYASAAPRFPYVEATGARLNLKLDQEKIPVSLTDADFSLWLPEPRQWRFRLEAHPNRTDIAPADTGALRLEGTLGDASVHASSIQELPIDLRGDWREVQFGGLSHLLLGHDAGVRGDLTLNINVRGTIGRAIIVSTIKVAHARRADFIPLHLVAIDASCKAIALDTFHAFPNIECHWPPPESSDPSVLIVSASIPDVRDTTSSVVNLTLPALPAATLLGWLQAATPHPPTGMLGQGTLAGTLVWHPSARSFPALSGELEFAGESLRASSVDVAPIPLGDVLLRSMPMSVVHPTHSLAQAAPADPTASRFDLQPLAIALGGRQPATVEGHFDASGYTLHLIGQAVPARLLALAAAIPQFGEGIQECLQTARGPSIVGSKESNATPLGGAKESAVLSDSPPDASLADAQPTHFDLTATRTWGGPQVWHQTPLAPLPARHHSAK